MNHECHLRFDNCADVVITTNDTSEDFLSYSECLTTNVNSYVGADEHDVKLKRLITNETMTIISKLCSRLHCEILKYARSDSTQINHYQTHVLIDVIKLVDVVNQIFDDTDQEYINTQLIYIIEFCFRQILLFSKIIVHIPALINDRHKTIENVLNYLSGLHLIEIVREIP
ncbi:hypothetical protein [Neodiprion sertifer nucleopolyhedrovirus]|uniref:Uncharacterized protein n=2 Tax=Baculoviridae TaxID=10442 RepID=Q6JKD5_9CBAC|nr:hypothetical protein NeseNPV_gp25 [Neodiprion sertifer nucleopolyhedrovirus]AAQ96402.1 hypothetical protein [Neodiprion sertifer nucleopolyhedrovirus]UZH98329.1 p18 [Neodiprion sertifer nucleopolyhedrovirus]